MRVAVASGKGGTGKTTLAVNLAALLADEGRRVRLVDADVEEPDCALFLHPAITSAQPAGVLVPRIDEGRCTACRVCADVCAFRAVTVVGDRVLVFPELCHSCGACSLLCPESAISEMRRDTGLVEIGTVIRPTGSSFTLVAGTMTVGEAKAVPTTRATLAAASGEDVDVVLIDTPPGTSCPVLEAVRGSDVVVLVTEPTPFGLNDLRLAVEMVRALDLLPVIAINRFGLGDRRVAEYCAAEGLQTVLEMPNDRRVAEACARGDLLVDALPALRGKLRAAWSRIVQAASMGVRV